MPDADPFLAEAQRRGLVSAAQAEEVRRLAASFAEVNATMTVEEIAARKGFVSATQAAEIRRALAKKRVGRYEVIEKLGEGAGGIVWKARDLKLDRVVALKVLSQKAQATPEFRERFAREARIATTLNHVNIVRGLDHGEADGYQFFAMEFVEGESAESLLARLGRVPEKRAVAMTLDVVRALQHAKKIQLVHRDVKPGNLIVAKDGHVKLGDLGLAKPYLTEKELSAGDGSTAGTAYYMSPEQITAPDSVDWRSDVYSLGATLYHLLAGVPPFRPDAAGGVIHKHLHEKAQNPREHVLEIGGGAASVVLRMLQKKPQDRYDSLEALAADLEAVLAGRTPEHVEPPPPPEVLTDQRHARLAIAKRITAENLPREHFPWTNVAMFVIVAALMAVVGTSVYSAREKAKAAVPPSPPAHVELPPKPPSDAGTARDPIVKPPEAPNDSAAREDFARFVAQRVQPEVEAGRFASARNALLAYPAIFSSIERVRAATDLAAAERARVDGIARGRLDEKLRVAVEAAKRHDFEAAASLLDEAARIETPFAEEATKTARGEVEAARRAFAQAREDQARPFADFYGETILVAGEKGLPAARALLDAGAKRFDAYDEEAAELGRDLDRLAKAHDETTSTKATDLNGALQLLLVDLEHGELVPAEGEIEEVRRQGGDAEAARERIARVRGALARRADAVLAKAEAARAAGKLDEAYAFVQDAKKILSDHAPVLVMEGRVRLEQRRVEEAKKLLSNVARGRDAPPEAHLWYGKALLAAKDDLLRAETELREFLDEASKDDPSRADAESAWKEAHALRVEADAKRWRESARAAKIRGETAKAEGAWGRVAELLPDDVEALFALGQIYYERPSQRGPAFSALSRVVALAPADSPRRRSAETMLAALRRANVFVGVDGRDAAQDGDRWFARDAWDKAIEQYSVALQVSPFLASARMNLVRAYLARFRETNVPGDASAAATVAEELVVTRPDDSASFALRSSARLAAGDKKGALDDAAKAVIFDEKNASARLALGAAQLAEGRDSDAEKSFRTAYDLDPGPAAMLGLARCHVARGDFASARSLLDSLRERHGVPREFEKEFAEVLARCSDGK